MRKIIKLFLCFAVCFVAMVLITGCSGSKEEKQAEVEEDTSIYVVYMVKDDIYRKIKIEAEINDYSVSDPDIAGYTFEGWYKNKANTILFDDAEIENATENVYVYAKLTPITYTITYNENGGSISGSPTTSYNVETNMMLATPVKNGYTFLGWCKNENLSDAPIKSISEGTTGNLVLYAKWEVTVYTITYVNTKGATNTNAKTYTMFDEITINNLELDGYIFGGFYTNSSYTGSAVTQIEMGSTGNKTFYAKMTPVVYSINYNYLEDGTNNASNPSSYTIESSTITLRNPTRNNFTFLGWFKNEQLTQPISSIPQGSKGTINLYAKWEFSATAYDALGSGTEEDPYLIYNAEQFIDAFKYRSDMSSILHSHFKLMDDIVIDENYGFNNTSRFFAGVLDGNNKTITTTSNVSSGYIMPFKLTGIIENVKFKVAYPIPLVYQVEALGVVNNCKSEAGNLVCNNSYGVITNYNYGTIINCENHINITFQGSSGTTIGGIVNFNYGGTIESCSNYGNLNGTHFLGGIVGSSGQEGNIILNCVNYGTVSGGGIAGSVGNGIVQNCVNYGSISGLSGAGIVRALERNSSITSCDNYGSIGSSRGCLVAYFSDGSDYMSTITIKDCTFLSNDEINVGKSWYSFSQGSPLNNEESVLGLLKEGSNAPVKVTSIPEE